jgi:hypothetical protein
MEVGMAEQARREERGGAGSGEMRRERLAGWLVWRKEISCGKRGVRTAEVSLGGT